MEKPKSNKSMMIVIIILLFLLIGIIVGLAIYLTGLMSRTEEEPEYTTPPIGVVSVGDIKMISLDKTSTNMKIGEDGKKRVFVASFAIGINMSDKVAGEALSTLITEHVDIAKDIVNGVIWNTTYAELMAENGETLIIETILSLLQEKFESNLIYEVYMSNIATQ